MPASPELLESLAADLALEHAAILQYIVQGRQLKDSALANDVMEMAREEMWHFEWLAEAIRDRGGKPSVARGEIFFSAGVGEGMRADVGTEQMAIDHYAATLSLIGASDPELRELVERIVDDEHHHRAAFAKLAARVEADGDAAHAPHPAIPPTEIAHVAPMMGLEYEGLLRNLMGKYGCGECEQAETYFELAIEEMRHAAWAAGFLVGFGTPQAPPDFSATVVAVGSSAEAAAQVDEFEARAGATYASLAEAAGDADLRATIQRAARQHVARQRKLERLG